MRREIGFLAAIFNINGSVDLRKQLRRPIRSLFSFIALLLSVTTLLGVFNSAYAANYSENFDDGLAQGWTATGWTVSSNVYNNSNVIQTDRAIYSGATWNSSYTYHARVYNGYGSSGNTAGLVFNYQDSNNFAEVVIAGDSPGTVTLSKVISGTVTSQSASLSISGAQTWFDVDVIRSGSATTVKVNGTTIFNNVDQSGLNNGSIGLVSHWTNGSFDNVALTDNSISYSEDFGDNAAQGWSATSWSVSGGIYYSTNGGVQTTRSLYNNATWNTSYTYHARTYNQYGAWDNHVGVVFNYQDDNNYGEFVIGGDTPGTAVLTKVVGGTTTNQTAAISSTGTSTWIDVDIIRSGSSTTVKVNGATVFNNIDQSGLPNGKIGLVTHWSVGQFDNITVSGASTGGGSSTILFPRLGAYPIGGNHAYDQDSNITKLSKMEAVVLNNWDGWQTGRSKTWAQTVSAITSNSPLATPTKVIAYFDPMQENPNHTSSDADYEIKVAADANNWWLRTTYPSGSCVAAIYYSSSLCMLNMYYPGGNNDSAGRTMWQWEARYFLDYNREGGAYGLTNGSNSAATALGGMYQDDVCWKPGCTSTVNGDFNRDGTTDSSTTTSFYAPWSAGVKQVTTEMRSLHPELLYFGNLSQFSSSSSVTYATPFLAFFEGGVMEAMLGETWSSESWGGFSEMKNAYTREWALLKDPKLGIFGHNQLSSTGTDPYDTGVSWRAMRYGFGTATVLGDALYAPMPSSYDVADMPWLDEFAVGSNGVAQSYSGTTAAGLKWLGTSSGSYTVLSSGIHIRFFQNGVVAVNPKGNGQRSLTTTDLGGSGLYRRISGTQDSSVNSGATVTGNIVMPDRSAIFLQKVP